MTLPKRSKVSSSRSTLLTVRDSGVVEPDVRPRTLQRKLHQRFDIGGGRDVGVMEHGRVQFVARALATRLVGDIRDDDASTLLHEQLRTADSARPP